MKVILRTIAEKDVDAAVEWYEEQTPGLGDQFLMSVRQTLERIGAHPEAYPLVHPPRLRRILLPDFPYGLFYLVEPNRAVVTACFMFGRVRGGGVVANEGYCASPAHNNCLAPPLAMLTPE